MTRDPKKPHKRKENQKNDCANGAGKNPKRSNGAAGLLISPKLIKLKRDHTLTARTISLSSKLLASRVGCLTIEAFPALEILRSLPARSFTPGQLIPCDEVLCLIKRGSAEIRHSRHKYPVKTINAGGVFGEMPLLGQTMLVTEAVAGDSGAEITTINVTAAKELVADNPILFVETLGPRLALAERDYFRAQFQLHDSMVAEVLLRLANGSRTIEGITQEELADSIGIYRETVNVVLNELRAVGLIEIHNKSITILDKDALRELSAL